MPPKEMVTLESIKTLVDKYTDAIEAWDRKHRSFSVLLEEIQKKDEVPDQKVLDYMHPYYDTVVKKHNAVKGVYKIDPDYETKYPDVDERMEKIDLEYMRILNLKPKATVADVTNADEKVVKDQRNEMSAVHNLVDIEIKKLESSYSTFPDPTEESVNSVNKIVSKLNSYEETSSQIYVKLIGKLDKDEQVKLRKEFEAFTEKINKHQITAQSYLGRFEVKPSPIHTISADSSFGDSARTSGKSDKLERLPLPTFDGSKLNYQRFKKEFNAHVTYETDKQRMIALKQKCLLKENDKRRVMNEITVAACFKKLDEEYGDVNTLVAEIFKTWRAIKPPKTDQDFINFVDEVEIGIALLKSIGKEKELDFSYMAVELEDKLHPFMKKEFTRILAKADDEKERMTSLIDFLILEKKAAHIRCCNYTSSKARSEEKIDKPTKANSSGTEGRGGGKNRGKSQHVKSMDKTNKGDTQKGKTVRGEISKDCLVCGRDHGTSNCDFWRDISTDKHKINSKVTQLPKMVCFFCLEPGHSKFKCRCEEPVGCPCGSKMSMFICCATEECVSRENWGENNVGIVRSGSGIIKSNATSLKQNGLLIGQSLMPIVTISTRSGSVLKTLFDSASQSTFVSEKAARRMNLVGIPIKYTLVCTDGKSTSMTGKMYNICLCDKNGNNIYIDAIGIQKLSGKYSEVKVVGIRKIFGRFSVEDRNLSRNSSGIDLLIGADLAELHPKTVATHKKLVLQQSRFGSGWTVFGYDMSIIKTGLALPDWNAKVNFVQAKDIEILDSCLSAGLDIKSSLSSTKDTQFLDSVSIESVGVTADKTCNCSLCKVPNQQTSFLESLQDKQIEESIEFNEKIGKYIASYPYTKEVYELLPDSEMALNRNKALETTLMKSPVDLESANKILFDSFERGVFVWISQEQMDNWDGPVHYVPMNRVYKDSKTTPCRLTFDSSQPDRNGRSLNGCLGKGSNPLNYFSEVILNWRVAEQVACGDISKMYNQVHLRDFDLHVRRFYMRPDGFGGKEDWKVAAVRVVNFGEKPAGSVATAVKNRVAEENKSINPAVCKDIKKNCFMDDVNIKAKYSENIQDKIDDAVKIMGKGGFQFNDWVVSGQKGEKQIGKDVSKALGVFWKPEEDKIIYRVKINFSKKYRNRRLNADTTLETLKDDFPSKFTKRIALMIVHSVFDPAMLIQPFILKLRLAYREILIQEKLAEKPLNWDDVLSDKARDLWIKLSEEMFELNTISFPRSVVPRDYDPDYDPWLLLFSDYSDKGTCVVGYLRWKMLDGTYKVTMVTSRVKIASLLKKTTPHGELIGGQMSSRLKVWLLSVFEIRIAMTIHIVDSSVVLGMIQNISLKFDTFVAPRVSEIQSNNDSAKWYWTKTSENPADIGSRGNISPKDLGVGSMWQEGPSFLKLEFECWDVREDFKNHLIPGIKKEFELLSNFNNVHDLISYSISLDEANTSVHKSTVSAGKLDSSHLEKVLSKCNDWLKMHLVLSRILKWRKCYMGVNVMQRARNIILRMMMPATKEMLKSQKFPDLLIQEDKTDGFIYVITRNTKNNSYNPDKLILLSPKHPWTKLILKSIHEAAHKGNRTVIARSRLWFWIPQAFKLVRSIQRNCYTCRLLNAQAMKQIMSPLPGIRLKPANIWKFTMLDLCGPIFVSDFVKQRSRRKTWIVIFTCLVSRVVWCYLAEDYSADSLLIVLAKHEARFGSPSVYYSDLGTNIKGADRSLSEIEAMKSSLNQQKLNDWAAKREVNFKFGVPHFPQGQGAVERLVGEIKKALKVVTGSQVFSFGQLDAAVSECSYIVNCRPLQYSPEAGGDGGFICPNDLIMGRSDKKPPVGPFEATSLTRKLKFIRNISVQFWDRWKVSYYQNLVNYHRWKVKSRNASVGDIVCILDKEDIPGHFTLGEISSVKMDEDKIVRKVMVRYKLKNKGVGSKYTPACEKFCERNVRGLALLVTKKERDGIYDIEDYESQEVEKTLLESL